MKRTTAEGGSLRRSLSWLGWLLVVVLCAVAAWYMTEDWYQPDQILTGLKNADDSAHWRKAATAWREDTIRNKQRYENENSLYLPWIGRDFVQTQMMVEDRYFYDPTNHKYTVNRYLDDLLKRYGGIDSVLIWPGYPNIGIDARNQFDLIADMPSNFQSAINDFHKRGVRVLLPVLRWDDGTRDEGSPIPLSIVKLGKALRIDGINGDTMLGVPKEYADRALAIGFPMAFEPELQLHKLDMLAWNKMTWGYWPADAVPPVSRYKWLDRRHMVHVCERWAVDRNPMLQNSFFNGVGYESWENIFGVWNQLSEHDAEVLRRTHMIERTFADLLQSEDWQPFSDSIVNGVYVSRFAKPDMVLSVLVNRNNQDFDALALPVTSTAGWRYFDLWHGVEFKLLNDRHSLPVKIEAGGYGAVLATRLKPNREINTLLEQMSVLSKRPLATFSTQWRAAPQHLLTCETPNYIKKSPASSTPVVLIPGGKFQFAVSGVEIEGRLAQDVQYPWEEHAQQIHSHEVVIKPFFMDKFPVTNADFKRFLDNSGYKPADTHNFLRHWIKGDYPAGWAKKPVTWVSLEDARAYASWSGKRLPHEWEWQYAAQGNAGYLYPWGNLPDSAAVPAISHERSFGAPDNVDAHPRGASSFGVMDLVGNVWQWTDEYEDEHTRAAIIRGGSYFAPQNPIWYFPENRTLVEHGKYLLMYPGRDRAATIGFRCVADTP